MRRFLGFMFDLFILRILIGLIVGIITLPFRLLFMPFGFCRHWGYRPHRRYYW
ncbi:MAG: hypothetical protein IKI62_06695 [Clostridia bacterium]|nr:hypothetical protein [Clostridia bacterium]